METHHLWIQRLLIFSCINHRLFLYNSIFIQIFSQNHDYTYHSVNFPHLQTQQRFMITHSIVMLGSPICSLISSRYRHSPSLGPQAVNIAVMTGTIDYFLELFCFSGVVIPGIFPLGKLLQWQKRGKRNFSILH